MKTHLCLGLMIWASVCMLQAQPYLLTSPNQLISVRISPGAPWTYSVQYRGQMVLADSPLDLQADSVFLGQNTRVLRTRTREVRGKIPVQIPIKADTLTEAYNELRLEMRGDYALVFRAYDEGVAYRWETAWKKSAVLIQNETVAFQFPGKAQMYFPSEKSFFAHQEPAFERLSTEDQVPLGSLPVLIQLPNGPNCFIAESGLEDYPGLWIRAEGSNRMHGIFPAYPLKTELSTDRDLKVVETAPYIARTSGSRVFPWRILGIAETDAALLTNSLVWLLAKPAVPADYSWIRPGKVAWDWWNANNIYGVDFPSGLNTATYKYYIDFAAKNGIEYVILDEGYYILGDVLKFNPDIDMEALAAYAREKNVGLILWVVWNTLEDKLEEALARYEKWGIKGIKVDFMQRDDQVLMEYYHRVCQLAAKHKLLVDFHGSNRPILLARTYPHLITAEGVRGLEWTKWSDSVNPEHDLILPFTRMLLGPMDYTPGAMINVKKENFRAVFDQPMSLGTRCHQLGMYVVYESPLQMLADNPSNYEREPECMEFLSSVPVTWDETRVLEARVGDYVVVARRKGNTWHIGGLTDWTEREFSIDLSFLPPGNYTLTEWTDGVNAHRHGSDFKKKTSTVTSASKVTVRMAPGGGYAATIE